MKAETNKQMKGGRKPKAEPIEFRYSVNFTAKGNAEFLTRFEQSGLKIKAQFISNPLANTVPCWKCLT